MGVGEGLVEVVAISLPIVLAHVFSFPDEIFSIVANEGEFASAQVTADERSGIGDVGGRVLHAGFGIFQITLHSGKSDVAEGVSLAVLGQLNAGCRGFVGGDCLGEGGESGVSVLGGVVLCRLDGVLQCGACSVVCGGIAGTGFAERIRCMGCADGECLFFVVDFVGAAGDFFDGERAVDDAIAVGDFFKEEADAVVLLERHGGVGRASEADLFAECPAGGEGLGSIGRRGVDFLIPDGDVVASAAERNRMKHDGLLHAGGVVHHVVQHEDFTVRSAVRVSETAGHIVTADHRAPGAGGVGVIAGGGVEGEEVEVATASFAAAQHDGAVGQFFAFRLVASAGGTVIHGAEDVPVFSKVVGIDHAVTLVLGPEGGVEAIVLVFFHHATLHDAT